MLVIRYRRAGKKNQPSYRIVLAEHSYPINGKFIEDLGFYNPHTKATGLKKDEILAWLNKGAQPSNSVARLLTKEKVKHNSIVVVKKNKKSKQVIEEKAAKTETPAQEAVVETVVEEPAAEVAEETAPVEETVAEVPATE